MSWRETLAEYLRWHHPHVSVDDLVPTDTPGYWRRLTECRGGCMPMAHTIPMHHTISYFDPQRRGRFTSPYRTWREAREALGRYKGT